MCSFEVCSCEGVYDEVYSYEVVVACGVVVKPMYCVLVCVLVLTSCTGVCPGVNIMYWCVSLTSCTGVCPGVNIMYWCVS